MGEIVSVAVPVKYRPSFNAGTSEKTATFFSVIKLATSGSFIFPNEISHSEQQRLKKTNNYSTKMIKNEAKKNIAGLITVEKFQLANPVCYCSTFGKSLLVAPWSLTLAGLILAGANSKPHDYKQKYKKNEGPFENMGFNRETVWRFRTIKK